MFSSDTHRIGPLGKKEGSVLTRKRTLNTPHYRNRFLLLIMTFRYLLSGPVRLMRLIPAHRMMDWLLIITDEE
jgi:hypothetical protein